MNTVIGVTVLLALYSLDEAHLQQADTLGMKYPRHENPSVIAAVQSPDLISPEQCTGLKLVDSWVLSRRQM